MYKAIQRTILGLWCLWGFAPGSVAAVDTEPLLAHGKDIPAYNWEGAAGTRFRISGDEEHRRAGALLFRTSFADDYTIAEVARTNDQWRLTVDVTSATTSGVSRATANGTTGWCVRINIVVDGRGRIESVRKQPVSSKVPSAERQNLSEAVVSFVLFCCVELPSEGYGYYWLPDIGKLDLGNLVEDAREEGASDGLSGPVWCVCANNDREAILFGRSEQVFRSGGSRTAAWYLVEKCLLHYDKNSRLIASGEINRTAYEGQVMTKTICKIEKTEPPPPTNPPADGKR